MITAAEFQTLQTQQYYMVAESLIEIIPETGREAYPSLIISGENVSAGGREATSAFEPQRIKNEIRKGVTVYLNGELITPDNLDKKIEKNTLFAAASKKYQAVMHGSADAFIKHVIPTAESRKVTWNFIEHEGTLYFVGETEYQYRDDNGKLITLPGKVTSIYQYFPASENGADFYQWTGLRASNNLLNQLILNQKERIEPQEISEANREELASLDSLIAQISGINETGLSPIIGLINNLKKYPESIQFLMGIINEILNQQNRDNDFYLKKNQELTNEELKQQEIESCLFYLNQLEGQSLTAEQREQVEIARDNIKKYINDPENLIYCKNCLNSLSVLKNYNESGKKLNGYLRGKLLNDIHKNKYKKQRELLDKLRKTNLPQDDPRYGMAQIIQEILFNHPWLIGETNVDFENLINQLEKDKSNFKNPDEHIEQLLYLKANADIIEGILKWVDETLGNPPRALTEEDIELLQQIKTDIIGYIKNPRNASVAGLINLAAEVHERFAISGNKITCLLLLLAVSVALGTAIAFTGGGFLVALLPALLLSEKVLELGALIMLSVAAVSGAGKSFYGVHSELKEKQEKATVLSPLYDLMTKKHLQTPDQDAPGEKRLLSTPKLTGGKPDEK